MDDSRIPQRGPDLDDRLWVELTDSEGRWFLIGNPHTLPGRFDVWSPELGYALTISKSDIEKASDAAHWWIEGFLHGNEPSHDDYVGTNVNEAGILDDSHPAYPRWRKALDQFRRTGATMWLERRLLDNDLVDEMTLFTFPVVVGKGTRLFPDVGPDMALDLVGSRATPSGVTIQVYRPAGRPQHGTASPDTNT